MGFRFRRSMKLMPGVRLNLSKSGLGLSLGVPGARVSLNPHYGARTTVGISGTGLSYSKQVSAKKLKGATTPSKPHKSTFSPIPTAEIAPAQLIVACPHCRQKQYIPDDCGPNVTLVCAHCKKTFTPPLELFVDEETDAAPMMPNDAPPREVHLVLYSAWGEQKSANRDLSESTLEEELESMPIGDGSRLALISQYGFVQAFRSGKQTYRVEWRNREGENRYVGGLSLPKVMQIYQDYTNNHNIIRAADWNILSG